MGGLLRIAEILLGLYLGRKIYQWIKEAPLRKSTTIQPNLSKKAFKRIFNEGKKETE